MNDNKRILTSCTTCGESLQTDGDQTPRDSELFSELLWNFDDYRTPIDHTHTLTHEEV